MVGEASEGTNWTPILEKWGEVGGRIKQNSVQMAHRHSSHQHTGKYPKLFE